MQPRSEMGQAIHDLRVACEELQREFALRFGLSTAAIHAWECGSVSNMPRARQLCELWKLAKERAPHLMPVFAAAHQVKTGKPPEEPEYHLFELSEAKRDKVWRLIANMQFDIQQMLREPMPSERRRALEQLYEVVFALARVLESAVTYSHEHAVTRSPVGAGSPASAQARCAEAGRV